MTTDTQHIIPGDTLDLRIKGKVVDPALTGTPKATTLRITRPAKGSSLYAASFIPGFRVEAVLEASTEVTYEITSQYKNGVHIDSKGVYWMRRPDGWHAMKVDDTALADVSSQFAPPGVQRLKEDTDQ